MINEIHHGDCLDLMRDIPTGSIDMILCDLPYGTTACKWDTIIPFADLWAQYERIIKPNGAIVLTAAQPFTTALIASNIKMFHHSWVWAKRFGANFPQAKRQPLRVHEDIIVFGRCPLYYPHMTKRKTPITKGANKGASVFNSSGLSRDDYAGKVYDHKYPESIIEISSRAEVRGLHPTQKPVALFEYLIKTYTNPGEVVLDNCMGSGTTAIAALNTGRQFIGIEQEEKYVAIGRARVAALQPVLLF